MYTNARHHMHYYDMPPDPVRLLLLLLHASCCCCMLAAAAGFWYRKPQFKNLVHWHEFQHEVFKQTLTACIRCRGTKHASNNIMPFS